MRYFSQRENDTEIIAISLWFFTYAYVHMISDYVIWKSVWSRTARQNREKIAKKNNTAEFIVLFLYHERISLSR